MNSKKTELMVVSRNNECPQINILSMGIKSSRGINSYTLISSDGHKNIEIASSKKEFSEIKINTNK